MAEGKYCPDCGDPLNPGSAKCACGWKRPKGTFTQQAKRDPRYGLCEWEDESNQCPAPGTMSSDTREGKGPWFCPGHYKATNKAEGRKVLYEYQKNGLPDRTPYVVSLMKLRMKQNPKDYKQPGESHKAYVERMREKITGIEFFKRMDKQEVA